MRTLKPEIRCRVVARGEHDAADRLIVARDRPAQRGRGQVAIGDLDAQPVRGEHLGRRAREAAGLEARVVADDDDATGAFCGPHTSRGIGHPTQALVGEVLGDHGAPAVGAESDIGVGCHRYDSLPYRNRASDPFIVPYPAHSMNREVVRGRVREPARMQKLQSGILVRCERLAVCGDQRQGEGEPVTALESNVHAIILAGGSGARYWPLSREMNPKQMLSIFGGTSLITQSVERVRPFVGPTGIHVLTNERLRDEVRNHLTAQPTLDGLKIDVLAEPIPRNTAAAIALAAAYLCRLDPEALMMVVPSDHILEHGASWEAIGRLAIEAAEVARLSP